MGVRIVGVDFQGLLEVLNGIVWLPFLEKNESEVIVAHPTIRVLGQRVAPECLVALINPVRANLPCRGSAVVPRKGPTATGLFARTRSEERANPAPASANGPMLARYCK